jgi:hypothetical protein
MSTHSASVGELCSELIEAVCLQSGRRFSTVASAVNVGHAIAAVHEMVPALGAPPAVRLDGAELRRDFARVLDEVPPPMAIILEVEGEQLEPVDVFQVPARGDEVEGHGRWYEVQRVRWVSASLAVLLVERAP